MIRWFSRRLGGMPWTWKEKYGARAGNGKKGCRVQAFRFRREKPGAIFDCYLSPRMIRNYSTALESSCREFLLGNPSANYAHDPAWLAVIRETYGKETVALVLQDSESGPVRGLALAAALKSPGGGKLVALPYLDYGGPLGDSPEALSALREALYAEAGKRKARLEIRSLDPLPGIPDPRNEKVAMILSLKDGDGEAYWKSLDAKVRNQVRKAEKSAVTVQWGREERLEDFYRVFCVNMRDLGSPVHSGTLFASVLRHFPGAQVGTAHREGRCIGGLFRILWKDSLIIPWASTLREERIHNPNNALYWESIRFAFEKKCARVDFGRSSKDEGTYKFKRQWLAEERLLYWYQFGEDGKPFAQVNHVGSGRMQWAPGVWMRLPLPVVNAVGPWIRGHISA